MRSIRLIVGGAVLLLIITAVWATQRPDTHRISPNIQTALKELPLLHGVPVTDAMFDGKVIIVTFFASWCAPCREEFGHLKQLHTEHHAKGLEVIAVNLFEDFDNLSNDKRLARFLALTDPPFTVVKGSDLISRHFGTIRRIPTLLIYDRQGQQTLRFANGVGGQQMTLDIGVLRQVVSGLQ